MKTEESIINSYSSLNNHAYKENQSIDETFTIRGLKKKNSQTESLIGTAQKTASFVRSIFKSALIGAACTASLMGVLSVLTQPDFFFEEGPPIAILGGVFVAAIANVHYMRMRGAISKLNDNLENYDPSKLDKIAKLMNKLELISSHQNSAIEKELLKNVETTKNLLNDKLNEHEKLFLAQHIESNSQNPDYKHSLLELFFPNS